MAATTTFRATPGKGVIPTQLTLPVAANVLLLGGTMITVDADGRADVVTAGQHAVGIASAHADNRTTAPEGGAAGAINVEIECGVKGLAYTGTVPESGQVVYVVDNQTVSIDSDTGSRGIAGYCIEVRNGLCWVWMGPHVAGQIVIAASEASQLDLAQADIVEIRTDLARARQYIPIDSLRVAAGTKPAAFADGSADGFVVNEHLMFRWNVNSTAALWTTVALPDDLDEAANVEVHMLVSREGGADTDLTITVGAFFIAAGEAYTADANCGGATGAITSATTVVSEALVALAAADVPAGPVALGLSIVPASTLNADDLNLHALWLEYTKTVTSA